MNRPIAAAVASASRHGHKVIAMPWRCTRPSSSLARILSSSPWIPSGWSSAPGTMPPKGARGDEPEPDDEDEPLS